MVTLAEARKVALENRRAVANGIDPRVRDEDSIPSFEESVEQVIAIHIEGWKDAGRSAQIWRSSLDAYAMPRLGRKPVSEISTADVMAGLLPIWATKAETDRRLKHRISAVMRWAIAQGYRQDNPAGEAISAALPKTGKVKQHQRALPFGVVGSAVSAVRETGAWPATKLAFEVLTLTATRSGEVRNTRWEEIDEQSLTWTVPRERMKSGREHSVPLSSAALILQRRIFCRMPDALPFPS